MPKFAVSLHGTGCRVEVTKRRWGLLRQTTIRPAGFYTTRFVEAATSDEAAARAIAVVQEELKDLNHSDSPASITAEGVREDEEGFFRYAPGSGFTWYLEDDSASP